MMATRRPLDELKRWARPALAHRQLVEIAQTSSSPNSAYNAAFSQFGNAELARATRWLAAVKRDYGEEALKEFLQGK